jgi:hypothetical protein
VSSRGTLQRLAVVGIGSAAAVFALLASPSGVASAKPDECKIFGECMPDIPPDQPNHPGPIPYPPYQPQQDYRECGMTYNQQCVDWLP